MSRILARENVFKLIYERVIRNEKNPHSFEAVIKSTEESEKEYIISLYNGIDECLEFLQKIIERFAIDFKLTRIHKVDLAILLVATYEILFVEDIIEAISANEAVEIAKKFSNEDSGKFINGILASVIKDKDNLIEEFNKKDEVIEEEVFLEEIEKEATEEIFKQDNN
ncbi:MAG: transcription antitermination factor NusB [Firmicutes bacterium]|nr:transcription antitermination factor NusB [Bacillota bacterium]MCL2255686.1 transcription antitermination factor NusB [Bacillota bacterium]